MDSDHIRARVPLWNSAREQDPGAASRAFPASEPVLELGEMVNARNGSLLLADYGCAIEARLVLNGPARGDVWVLDGSNGALVPFGHVRALHDPEQQDIDERRFDFLTWYEHWLDTGYSAETR